MAKLEVVQPQRRAACSTVGWQGEITSIYSSMSVSVFEKCKGHENVVVLLWDVLQKVEVALPHNHEQLCRRDYESLASYLRF